MRIGLCGPSGTGKTTLAKYIAEVLDIPYKPLSATMVLEELGIDMGIKGMGHRWLINNSSKDVSWGLQVQARILESREATIHNMKDVVIDRTPVDNLVYAMYEVSHNSTESWIEDYRQKVFDFYKTFDLIIFIPYTDSQGMVEDNGSRIPNRYFQELITGIFASQLDIIHEHFDSNDLPQPSFLELNEWNYDRRKHLINRQFITEGWVRN